MKQLSFLPKIGLSHSTAHGGDLRKGKRKIARPFDPKRPIHIVLRSERARGKWSMLRHKERIERLLDQAARRYGVSVHRIANVGNHLHLIVSMGPGQKSAPDQSSGDFSQSLGQTARSTHGTARPSGRRTTPSPSTIKVGKTHFE